MDELWKTSDGKIVPYALEKISIRQNVEFRKNLGNILTYKKVLLLELSSEDHYHSQTEEY